MRRARKVTDACAVAPELRQLGARAVPTQHEPRPRSAWGTASTVVNNYDVDDRLQSKTHAARKLPQETRSGVLLTPYDTVRQTQALDLSGLVSQTATEADLFRIFGGQP